MTLPHILVGLLVVVCFGIAGWFEPRYEEWKGARRDNALSMLIGDSRRLFANHFFAKADAYFHGGYYPTIFDGPKPEEKSHMEESTEHDTETCTDHDHHDHHGKECTGHHEEEEEKHADGDFLEAPKDWIEAFGRNFFPTHHSHLNQSEFREILPWLRLTAELDPQKVETYTVAAFTLRTRLDKPVEAEEFLRDGLRANPDSYEILYELGRLRYEHDNDPRNARNILELALKKWQMREAEASDPNIFSLAQILGYLADLEEKQGDFDKAILHLEELKKISPFKEHLEKRIQELRAKNAAK